MAQHQSQTHCDRKKTHHHTNLLEATHLGSGTNRRSKVGAGRGEAINPYPLSAHPSFAIAKPPNIHRQAGGCRSYHLGTVVA